MKRFEGKRQGYTAIVTVDGRALDPRLDLWNHSPSGFEWGYCGSGPAQLALALLCEHLSNDGQALEIYQEFKRIVVANLPYRGWTLTAAEVEASLAVVRSNNAKLEGVVESDQDGLGAAFRDSGP